jgi:hypothetical protein
MDTKNWEDWGYEESEKVSCVLVEGDWIPVNTVEILNIEEDLHGRDSVTFKCGEKEYKSLVIIKFQ